ncbi:MAG: branched-chain amino acid ABC transporter ATP-binding protein, partial [Desulfobacterales bacterium]
ILLDEPSMGLAPMIVEKIMEVLEVLRSKGLTIVLVEQNALAALEVADRGYVFETGTVVLQGSAEELLADKDVKRAYLGKDYGDFYDAV